MPTPALSIEELDFRHASARNEYKPTHVPGKKKRQVLDSSTNPKATDQMSDSHVAMKRLNKAVHASWAQIQDGSGEFVQVEEKNSPCTAAYIRWCCAREVWCPGPPGRAEHEGGSGPSGLLTVALPAEAPPAWQDRVKL